MANRKKNDSNASPAVSRLTVVSYNLHGLNQGLPGIKDLMSLINPDVIMVQEHWLTSDNLFKLSNISENYFAFGSSAMDARVSSGPLFGRPFGGTAILIKNNLANVASSIANHERFTVVKIANWLIINVYFPCIGTQHRLLMYNDIVCEFKSIAATHSDCNCFIGGDFNTCLEDTKASAVNSIISNLITDCNLARCDVLFPTAVKFTYISDSLNCSNTIDYMLTSCPQQTLAFNILDLDINLSDHLPLMAILVIDSHDLRNCNPDPIAEVNHFRWDHAALPVYYEQTRIVLEPVLVELNTLIDELTTIPDSVVACRIDDLYNCVIHNLYACSNSCIPKCKKNFFQILVVPRVR